MLEHVEGYCPECGGRTLILGAGGHVTCSWINCPDPSAVDALLNTVPESHFRNGWTNRISTLNKEVN